MDDLPLVGRPRMRSTLVIRDFGRALVRVHASNDDTSRAVGYVRKPGPSYVSRGLSRRFCGLLPTVVGRIGADHDRRQRGTQLTTRGDPELREHAVEMRADSA